MKKLTSEVADLNQIDLTKIQINYEELQSTAELVKNTTRSFINVASELSCRLVDTGAIEEASNIRIARSDARRDSNEIIRSINFYMGQLRRSNVTEISSLRSTAKVGRYLDSLSDTGGNPTPSQTAHDQQMSPSSKHEETNQRPVPSNENMESFSSAIVGLDDINIQYSRGEDDTDDSHRSKIPLAKSVDQHIIPISSRYLDSNVSQLGNEYSYQRERGACDYNPIPTSQTFSAKVPSNHISNPNVFQPISSIHNARFEVPHDADHIKPNFDYKLNVDSISNVNHTHSSTPLLRPRPCLASHSYSNMRKFNDQYEDRNLNHNSPSGNPNTRTPFQHHNNHSYHQRDNYNGENTISPSHFHDYHRYHQNDNSRNYHYPPSAFHATTQNTDSLSSFLLTQDLIRKSITPFDGSPINFWPWLNKVQDYTRMLRLTPLQILQLYESHTTGDPQKMIAQQLASTGSITLADVDDVRQTLTRRYGSTQKITNEILDKINKLPFIKNPNIGDQLEKLYDFCKIVRYNSTRCPELKMMDLWVGLNPIRSRLPEFIKREWAKLGQRYEDNNGAHPPFDIFVDFIRDQARLQSNKNYETVSQSYLQNKKPIKVLQTSVTEQAASKDYVQPNDITGDYCLFHKSKLHSLENCNGFKKLDFPTRKKFIYDSKLCYVCLGHHRATNCTSDIKCSLCHKRHNTVMHCGYRPNNFDRPNEYNNYGKNNSSHTFNSREDGKDKNVSTLCTNVCGDSAMSVNCSKTLLVHITMKGVPDKTLTAYCIIDEQSNGTLVDESVVDFFGKSFPTQQFKMKFASQNYVMKSEATIVSGLQVKGVVSDEVIDITEAISCPNLADTKNEVATPKMVKAHLHTKKYAKFFPEFDSNAQVLLLIGRNCARAMATENLFSKKPMEPYVHRCPLGYSLVGKVCTGDTDTKHVSVLRTDLYPLHEPITIDYDFAERISTDDIFKRKSDDDHPGFSGEDKKFCERMANEVTTTPEGNLQLPLPFKGVILPNNKQAVYARTTSTLSKLKSDHDTLNECIQTMDKNLKANYIEQVPESEIESLNPTWYLPIFGVNHHKKKKTRLVYDAAARYKGISLNDTLLAGPDLNNHLRSVLLRFREKTVAFAADIESMFSTFKVPKDQQDLLRFFWFSDNQPSNSLVPYRSTSHLFGCNCSPAVANFALRYCASIHSLDESRQSSVNYLHDSFYVDDGVCSKDSPQDAIDTLSGAIEILSEYNIRLHKIVSNSQEVLDHFPSSEISSTNSEATSTRILGVCWDTSDDTFVIEAPSTGKPFTARGILSYNNSFYDPIGFISPLVLTGRLFQRKVLLTENEQSSNESKKCDWDSPLPSKFQAEWNLLSQNLNSIHQIKLNRCFYSPNFKPVRQDLHIFSDASDKAIGYVAYLRSIDKGNNVEVSFVTATSKVAPRSATSIPRLELCAAAEAASCVTKIVKDFNVKPSQAYLYTDSTIVSGYIRNSRKRFSKYVERRVALILDHSTKENWQYVNTLENPADLASRPCHSVQDLIQSCWLKGPSFLYNLDRISNTYQETEDDDILPEETKEKELPVFATEVSAQPRFLDSFYNRMSEWTKIIKATRVLLKVLHLTDTAKQKLGTHLAPRNPRISEEDAIIFLVKQAQQEAFSDVLKCLHLKQPIPDSCRISKLSPYLKDDTIRVGGRLKKSD